jgi:hypothetical protein
MVHASLYLRPDRESALSEHRSIDADDSNVIKRESLLGASTNAISSSTLSKQTEKLQKTSGFRSNTPGDRAPIASFRCTPSE